MGSIAWMKRTTLLSHESGQSNEEKGTQQEQLIIIKVAAIDKTLFYVNIQSIVSL